MANLEIAEIAARSGANCGSLFLDLRFRELVKTVRLSKPYRWQECIELIVFHVASGSTSSSSRQCIFGLFQ